MGTENGEVEMYLGYSGMMKLSPAQNFVSRLVPACFGLILKLKPKLEPVECSKSNVHLFKFELALEIQNPIRKYYFSSRRGTVLTGQNLTVKQVLYLSLWYFLAV